LSVKEARKLHVIEGVLAGRLTVGLAARALGL